MPQQRQEQGLTGTMLNAPDNPLRTLLNGLKMMTDAPDDAPNPSAQPPSSSPSSSSIQPVPQMLVPNTFTFLQQRSVTSSQPNIADQTFLSTDQHRQLQMANNNQNGIDSNGRNLSNQRLPPPPPNSQPVLNVNGVTSGGSSTHQRPPQSSPNPRFQSQQFVSARPQFPVLASSLEAQKIALVFNRAPIIPSHPQLPQKPIHNKAPPPYPSGARILQPTNLIVINPTLQQPGTNNYNQPRLSNISVAGPVSINQSKPPPPLQIRPLHNMNVNDNSNNHSSPLKLKQSTLSLRPTNIISQSQTPRPNLLTNNNNTHSGPPLPNITQPQSPSINRDRLQEQAKIVELLKGFKQILENKEQNTVGVPTATEARAHGQTNETNLVSDVSKNGDGSPNGSRVIQVSTNSNNDEQPVVKSEVIEIDEGDEDCLLTEVDLSKRIFVLQKELDGITIDLLDDDDEMDFGQVRVKTEPKETNAVLSNTAEVENNEVVINNTVGDNCDNESDYIQAVTSSASNVIPTDSTSVKSVATNSEKPNSSKTTEEKKGKVDAPNNFRSPSNDKPADRDGKNNAKSNEVSQNPAANMKYFMSALGNILHSMKEVEGGRSHNDTSDSQSISTNTKPEDNSGSGTDSSQLVCSKKTPTSSSISMTNITLDKTRNIDDRAINGENCRDENTDRKVTKSLKGKASRITKQNLDAPLSSNQRSKSVSLPKLSEKFCSVSLNRSEIDIASMCKSNAKVNASKSTKNNSLFTKEKPMIETEKDDANDYNEKDDDDYNDDTVRVKENENNLKKPKGGNSSRKGIKRNRKPGPQPGSKRMKFNESKRDDEVLKKGKDKSSSSDRLIVQSSVNGINAGKKDTQSDEMRVTNGKVNSESFKSQEVTVKQMKGNKAVSGQEDIVRIRKKIEQLPSPRKPSNKAESSLSHDDEDDTEDDDSENDDSDDSDSMSDSSCSSVSDSSDDADVEYLCKLCSKSFSRRSQLKRHRKFHYKGNVKKVEKRIMCKGCRRKFTDETALQAHLVQRKYCFFDCTRAFWKKKGSSSKACRMCGKGQAKWKDLKKHFYRDLTCRLRFINLVLDCIKNRNSKEQSDNGVKGSEDEESKIRNKESKNKVQEDEQMTDVTPVKGKQLKSKIIRGTKSSKQSDHEQLTMSETSSSYHCGSCKKDFTTPRLFREHLNKNVKCKEFYLDPNNNSCPVKLNYCPLCSIFMLSHSKLLSHSCNGNSNTTKCDVCHRVFNDIRGVRAHQQQTQCGKMKNEGREDTTTRKTVVSKTSPVGYSKQLLKSPTKSLECIVCGKSFCQIQELLDHSHSHTQEGTYNCQDCSMSFERYNSLISHKIWHKRKMDLEKGQKDSEGALSLKGKESTASSSSGFQVKHKCKYCPLIFKSKISYNAHVGKHLAKQRRVKTGQNLIKNIKEEYISSQVDDMKFSCSRCGQRFSTLSGRNDHLDDCGKKNPGSKVSNVGNNNNGDDYVDVDSTITSSDKVKSDPHYACTLCSGVLKKKSFYRHLNFHRILITNSIKQNAKQSLSTPLKAMCDICKKVYSCNKVLLKHILTHRPVDIMTPVTKSFQPPLKRFRSSKVLKLSGAGKGNEGESGTGNLPSKTILSKDLFSPSGSLVRRKIAHKTYIFSCKICNKKFLNIITFKFHLKVTHKHPNSEGWSDYVNYLKDSHHDDSSNEVMVGENSSAKSKSSITSPLISDLPKKPIEITCEICQKVIQRKHLPRHMEAIHGLPKDKFLVRPRKSNVVNIKKEMQTTSVGSNNNSKDTSFPRIEVDMGGTEISASSLKRTMKPPAESSVECAVCEESFVRRGLLWKHWFSHIRPCWVTVMRLEDIIKEVPSVFEDQRDLSDDDGRNETVDNIDIIEEDDSGTPAKVDTIHSG